MAPGSEEVGESLVSKSSIAFLGRPGVLRDDLQNLRAGYPIAREHAPFQQIFREHKGQ